MSERVVFHKQSGEALTSSDELGQMIFGYDAEALNSSVDNLAEAYRLSGHLDIAGIVVVSGAGNLYRGDKLKKYGIGGPYADAMGLTGTISNTLAISAALDEREIPNKMLISDNMLFAHPTSGVMELHSNEAVKRAHGEGQLVLIAGGTGEDGKTTDSSVAIYASRYKQAYPNEQVIVLKGTEHFDGVHEGDPRENPAAVRYAIIGAPEMIDRHDKYGIVDKDSLITQVENEIDVRVFKNGLYPLVEILQLDPSQGNAVGIGTLIRWAEVEKVVAE